MQWKLSLDSLATDNTSHDKHFSRPATTASDHGAAENLNPLLGPFEDLGVDVDQVAHFEGVNAGFQRRLLGKSDDFMAHGVTSTVH